MLVVNRERRIYLHVHAHVYETDIIINELVLQIPDKDANGNVIPAWKRQMMAKKAAEKARKDLEEELSRQAEEKRLQSLPPWKRQLMQNKKQDDK